MWVSTVLKTTSPKYSGAFDGIKKSFIFVEILAIFRVFRNSNDHFVPKNQKLKNRGTQSLYNIRSHFTKKKSLPSLLDSLNLAIFMIFSIENILLLKSYTFSYIFPKPHQIRDTIKSQCNEERFFQFSKKASEYLGILVFKTAETQHLTVSN